MVRDKRGDEVDLPQFPDARAQNTSEPGRKTDETEDGPLVNVVWNGRPRRGL